MICTEMEQRLILVVLRKWKRIPGLSHVTNGANHNNSSVAIELVWNTVASRNNRELWLFYSYNCTLCF